MIKDGFNSDKVSQPKPHFSSVPGRKFSITISASAANLRTISCASGSFKFSVTDFLFRLCEYHHNDVPLCSLRQVRNGSPVSGGSILITSAPNCANNVLAYGPAISAPSSSTLTPSSAMGVSCLSCVIASSFFTLSVIFPLTDLDCKAVIFDVIIVLCDDESC